MQNLTHLKNAADQFWVNASVARDLEAFCSCRGLDFHAVADASGLDPRDFAKFETYVSLDRMCQLMQSLSDSAQDDTFGLKYGLYFRSGSSGAYGLGLRAAPTFKDMLDFYVRYSDLVAHSHDFDVKYERKTFALEWNYSPLIFHQDQFTDFSACAALKVFSMFAAKPVFPLKGRMKRSKPSDLALYEGHFSDQVIYNADKNALTFSSDLLDLENPAANTAGFEYMVQQCDTLLGKLQKRTNIVSMIADDLVQNLDNNSWGIANVAHRIGISERTLQRRLSEAGTEFNKISNEIHNDISLRFLIGTDKSISEIARILGYRSQSAYARAVKRLHGVSPSQIRLENRGRHPEADLTSNAQF